MTSIEMIIDRQIRRWELQRSLEEQPSDAVRTLYPTKPVITISRQRGTGGAIVAERLARRFNYTLLHRDTIDRICETAGYHRRIVESLDEHSKSQLAIWFESIITGQQVDLSDYARHLFQVVYSIARLGGVVVVGRGANFVIGSQQGFHARLVGSREFRIANIVAFDKMSPKDAAVSADRTDSERAEFVRQLIGKSIDDVLAYDMVLNVDYLPLDSVVNLIASAAMEKFEKLARDSESL